MCDGGGSDYCTANAVCSPHVSTCSNDYSFVYSPSPGDEILAAHFNDLKNGLDDNTTGFPSCFFSSNPKKRSTFYYGAVFSCGSSYGYVNLPVSAGNVVNAADINEVYNIVTNFYNTLFNSSGFPAKTSSPVSAGSTVISASHITNLQNDINTYRSTCQCNLNCSCNKNCVCNINCGCNYGGWSCTDVCTCVSNFF